jgi:glycosyltransferase involved in cell wall biosynthesis
MLVRDLIERRSRLAKSIWIRLVERSNVEGAAGIHATSQLEREELARFGWRLPQVFVIPNGIEDPSPAHGQIGADLAKVVADKPLVLFLGRISWKKGIDRLLRAFSHFDLGQLAIVGPDDEGLAPKLNALTAELGLGKRVHIVPREVIGHEKEALFAAAQVFVLSSYSENFGNTVLEAMRRAVPVILTPEVGVAELVRASNSGVVVGGEPSLLGAAISSLIGNPTRGHSMGLAGQRFASAHYSWENIAAQTEEMYKSLSERNAR